MQAIDGYSLYVQSGRNNAMRSLCTAAIHGAICSRYQGRGYKISTARSGRRVHVIVFISRWWLLALGLRHWWIARETTRLARKVAKRQAVDVMPVGKCQ